MVYSDDVIERPACPDCDAPLTQVLLFSESDAAHPPVAFALCKNCHHDLLALLDRRTTSGGAIH